MGRTGIRGKGVLWRWGPNHVIKAVSSRWRRKYSDIGALMDFLYVEGKRVLEFIAVKKVGEGDMESIYGLPGVSLYYLIPLFISLQVSHFMIFNHTVFQLYKWNFVYTAI